MILEDCIKDIIKMIWENTLEGKICIYDMLLCVSVVWMQLVSNAHAHITLTHYSSTILLSYSFILERLDMMDDHTLENVNKIVGMEKESPSGETEADWLHTMLIIGQKEQPSTMIGMEMNKTDFTRMVIG